MLFLLMLDPAGDLWEWGIGFVDRAVLVCGFPPRPVSRSTLIGRRASILTQLTQLKHLQQLPAHPLLYVSHWLIGAILFRLWHLVSV